MATEHPSPEEIAKWNRWFAVELNNRAWTIAENPARTSAEIEEMIDAAHAAALHWARVGNEKNKALADMTLGQAHALAENGKLALKYAGRSFDFFAASESANWEIAFAHAVLANAARAAGESALYKEHRAIAAEKREVIADPGDREIFDRTFTQIGKPACGDDDFLSQFETGTWPLANWHHRQHIKVAYLYLTRHPFPEAMDLIRERIKAYNAAHNIPDQPLSGYHETMTQAWMRLTALTLKQFGPADSADEFVDRSPQLSEKKILRLFYSAEVYLSPKAKVEFLEADLQVFTATQSDTD